MGRIWPPGLEFETAGLNNAERHKQSHSAWITDGLNNACKKKNTLYRQLIEYRSSEAENKYKRYKNKLTNIMRICKKEYYNKILRILRMKGLWKVLNSIVRDGAKSSGYPEFLVDKDNVINNTEDVVHGLNQLFVNVGPDLQKE